MVLTLVIVGCLLILGISLYLARRSRQRREVAQHSVSAEELYRAIHDGAQVKLFDVRQPLDLLANSEIIPGAVRIAPKEILSNPELIPREEDVVVYCTCPGDETSHTILKRARELQFTRIRILTGGLSAWKERGYPVTPYDQSFHLDTLS